VPSDTSIYLGIFKNYSNFEIHVCVCLVVNIVKVLWFGRLHVRDPNIRWIDTDTASLPKYIEFFLILLYSYVLYFTDRYCLYFLNLLNKHLDL
jgi:hypothetical protein